MAHSDQDGLFLPAGLLVPETGCVSMIPVKSILVGLPVTCYIPLDLEHPELLEYQMHPNKIQNIQFTVKKKTV